MGIEQNTEWHGFLARGMPLTGEREKSEEDVE